MANKPCSGHFVGHNGTDLADKLGWRCFVAYAPSAFEHRLGSPQALRTPVSGSM